MHRRAFSIGLLAGACTPLGGSNTDEDEPRTATPGGDDAALRLLVIAEWSGMFHSTSLAVYDDGLLDFRFPEEDGEGPFGPTYRRAYRVATAPPDFLEALRSGLASKAFRRAKPHYHEDGVMDGGALTMAGIDSERRIIIVNDPQGLPPTLDRLREALRTTAKIVEEMGHDPFESPHAPPRGRMLLVHDHSREQEDDALSLTVFEHGDIELRTTYDGSRAAHRKRDYPTPRSTVRRLDEMRLLLLREGVEALRASSVPREYKGGALGEVDSHWLTMAGPEGRFHVRSDKPVPTELRQVLDLSAEIAADYLP